MEHLIGFVLIGAVFFALAVLLTIYRAKVARLIEDRQRTLLGKPLGSARQNAPGMIAVSVILVIMGVVFIVKGINYFSAL